VPKRNTTSAATFQAYRFTRASILFYAMDEIEIEAFRADTKASKGLTAKHIADAAKSYDFEKNPAPLVFGHPTNDSPALGLISSARAEGNRLFLKVRDIADAAKTAVKERRVLGRS